ncbi:ABC transporter permease [Collinsella stercoris]|uniref:ABC transporter permease n=2 Tax=Collinsella stercoris TaxID=147206 RepID=UPI00248D5C84|nr:ABC transporter permease [Collinsella stercoris]
MATREHATATPRGGVFWRFAVRSLKLNRSRSIVSVIGIALSCALITAIFTSVVTLYQGLLKAEIVTEGTWQIELVDASDADLASLRSDPRIERIYERVSYGDALMPVSFEGYLGRYLSVHEWPTADAVGDLKPLPAIAEGREPQAPDEIVLPRDLKGLNTTGGSWLYDSLPATGRDDTVPRVAWDGELEVGSTMEVSLGQRMFIDPGTNDEYPCRYDEALFTTESPKGDVISEYLADPAPAQTFKVVGFYAPSDEGVYDQWGSSGPGYQAFVASPNATGHVASAYLATNLSTRADIDALVEEYTGASSAASAEVDPSQSSAQTADWPAAYLHDGLLRYQGLVDDRAIWGTLYTLAAILSGVVIVASVSLIYNSFAIAVSERTRQFGLLSSLGASKRQLRRSVYAEALMLAAIGIPAGLAIGLAGTFVVFNIAGEGIGMLIDQEVFADTGLTAITVDPLAIALSALLALLTVLVSATVPAWRASRVSAIDAIRQSRDVRLSRRERKSQRTAAHGDGHRRPSPARALDRLRMSIAGVPGMLAHRNLTRASSKGRVAVASLAVSVALIIISGAISHYLGFLTRVADSGGSDIEVGLNRLLQEDESTAEGLADIDRAYRALAHVEGATGEGYMLLTSLYGSFDQSMLDLDSLTANSEEYDMPDRGLADDGRIYAPLSILFLDEGSWNEILDENGLDRATYSDPDHPVAVALNGTQSNDGRRYSVRDLFTSTGTATLFTQIAPIEDSPFVEIGVDKNGDPVARYEGYGDEEGARYDEYGEALYQQISRPLDDVLAQSLELPVKAIVKTLPKAVTSYASIWPTLILPASALPALAEGSEDIASDVETGSLAAPFAFHASEGRYGNTMYAYLSFAAEQPRSIEAEMDAMIESDLSGTEWYRTYLNNNAENDRQARVMYETIQLFINCFIAITTAIAVANVFNTLANSIILRRREFAMLKSIGMGNRAFWRMIALECASYALRGLIIGLVLGAGVTFMVFQAMSLSFAGLDFEMPLGWVLGAIGLVVGVLALSTLYALRKSSAGSIVQTLREDAV